MKRDIPKISDFPTGEENTGFAQYFTGKSYLAPLTSDKGLNVPLANVTFEPGCRNNWHSHTGGAVAHRNRRRRLVSGAGETGEVFKVRRHR